MTNPILDILNAKREIQSQTPELLGLVIKDLEQIKRLIKMRKGLNGENWKLIENTLSGDIDTLKTIRTFYKEFMKP